MSYFRRQVRYLAGARVLPHRLRPVLLRLSGIEVGRDVLLFDGMHITDRGAMVIAPDVFIGTNCYFDTAATIMIERGCRIGDHVRIVTSTHEIGGTERRAGAGVAEGVVVGEGAWLGSGACILPGVRIGRGAIIAAGAVVTSNVENDTLYAGVPARLIRRLNEAYSS